ncbi:transporter substrate-binding domain-containing protein (plasmid) [Streptomyces sp. NBC_01426]|uniref:transporter substrate-binding domain-containing protein n=1 Tax=Streptomyces sp. NBC_01426 TaxID=2975866 RepID=UPI002E334327|nr:transporter substrate-binding domain-containing protein [Streptomyces sp. NBC_01426]
MARPLGELRGTTEQANELARWLRKITNGVGVRQLEADFPYSKSMWTQFRNGSRLVPRELLGQVVNRYLREPAMRQRQLDLGLRLLDEARQSAAARTPGEASELTRAAARPRHLDSFAQAVLRLDDARLRQMEAIRRLTASERRCEQLQDLVSALEQRCTLLEHERDRARDEVRAELQQALEMSVEYRRQANHKLKRARRARIEAYELRLAAETQVTRAQLGMSRDSAVPDEVGTALVPPSATAGSLASLEGLAPALHAMDDELDEDDQGRDELRTALRLPAVDRPVHDATLLRGTVEESPAEPPLSPSLVPGVGGVRPSAGDGEGRGEGEGGENRDNRDNEDDEDNGGGTGSAAAGATISRRTRTTTAALGCAVLATLGVLLAWDPPPWTTSPHDSLGGRDGGRLRIGVVVDAPGLSELNRGTISGFEAAMTGRLARSLGFTDDFELVPVTVEKRTAALRDGQVDMVIAHDEITEERRKQATFVGPYLRSYHGVLVKKGDKSIASFKDLNGRTICTREHAGTQEALIRVNKAKIVTRPDTEHCLQALRTGQADAVIGNQVALYGYTQKYADVEVPPAVTDGQPVGNYGIALPKGTSADVCKEVFKALQDYVRNEWEADFRTHLNSVVLAFPTTWNAFIPPEGDMDRQSSCVA